MAEQLLREWPPGYGGVERVAHELALVSGDAVYSFDAQPQRRCEPDPLPVSYDRIRLPRLTAGRLLVPLPSRRLWTLLLSSQPLHGHLPSPGVLALLLLARLLRPRRRVTAHWHCFLERSPGFSGLLFAVYQWLAEMTVPWLTAVITTSPLLAAELERCGCRPEQIDVLPCCLSAEQETAALALPERQSAGPAAMSVLFIGRLDSYKRVDWLLQALAQLPQPWRFDVVGDGPKRASLEAAAQALVGSNAVVRFHGRLDEAAKLQCLAQADLLVLPSDRCNEAFGIVQLEAMAAGIPALAFQRQRSGMGWVGQLEQFPWSQQPEALADVLRQLQADPEQRAALGRQSRQRYRRMFQRSVWLQQLQQLEQWNLMRSIQA